MTIVLRERPDARETETPDPDVIPAGPVRTGQCLRTFPRPPVLRDENAGETLAERSKNVATRDRGAYGRAKDRAYSVAHSRKRRHASAPRGIAGSWTSARAKVVFCSSSSRRASTAFWRSLRFTPR